MAGSNQAEICASQVSGWKRWNRRVWILCLIPALLFGALVELRSAYLHRRMGDLGVFLRTAWAVRAGQDIYTVTDNNGFHYHYPPLFAILLVPLADPPPGTEQTWTVPYAVSVAVWYALSLLCLAIAVHWLAGTLEPTGRRGVEETQRRAIGLRVLPVLACLPPIGHTLMRGQVSLLLLLLLCGMAKAMIRARSSETSLKRRQKTFASASGFFPLGRFFACASGFFPLRSVFSKASGWWCGSWQAGLWLAGAVCLKVIPAFLILHPLQRREGRCLAGCAAGLGLGLAVIPAAAFGPARTWAYYQEWTHVLLWPALGPGTDKSRAKELIEITATDSQSFQAIFHNTLYPNPATRPPKASIAVRCTHWLLGGFLTMVTLFVGRRRDDRPALIIRFGSLIVIMLLLSPVCHLHYFCLSLPLVMGSLAAIWEGNRLARKGMYAVVVFYGLANALPHFPTFQLLRDCGLATYATLLLWLVGMVILGTQPRTDSAWLDQTQGSQAAA